MKAVIKPRIDTANRVKLEEVIPLGTPFIINVDPSDKCNFRCKFCPTGDLDLMKNTTGRNHGSMDFGLYKKIVDDICRFEHPLKVLRLYKDGEPLLNRNFERMVEYAKNKKCANRIDTTTNAALLNPRRNISIINAGLDRINISIEGISEMKYLEFSKCRLDFEKLVENIAHFYHNRAQCQVLVKINEACLSEGDEKKFFEIFGDISDFIYVENVMSCWPEYELKGVRVNREAGIYGQEIKEVLVCPYVFYSFSINSDGTASACFLDWSRKLIIGDAKKQSVMQIWNSKKLKDMQRLFLSKKRITHPVCGICEQLSFGSPDNFDDYAEKILPGFIT